MDHDIPLAVVFLETFHIPPILVETAICEASELSHQAKPRMQNTEESHHHDESAWDWLQAGISEEESESQGLVMEVSEFRSAKHSQHDKSQSDWKEHPHQVIKHVGRTDAMRAEELVTVD